jgi:hypothetical protein
MRGRQKIYIQKLLCFRSCVLWVTLWYWGCMSLVDWQGRRISAVVSSLTITVYIIYCNEAKLEPASFDKGLVMYYYGTCSVPVR